MGTLMAKIRQPWKTKIQIHGLFLHTAHARKSTLGCFTVPRIFDTPLFKSHKSTKVNGFHWAIRVFVVGFCISFLKACHIPVSCDALYLELFESMLRWEKNAPIIQFTSKSFAAYAPFSPSTHKLCVCVLCSDTFSSTLIVLFLYKNQARNNYNEK